MWEKNMMSPLKKTSLLGMTVKAQQSIEKAGDDEVDLYIGNFLLQPMPLLQLYQRAGRSGQLA